MSTETTNLKLKKPSSNDFFNIHDFNDNTDKIDAAIADKADKTDIPTSLPADGGNADTVGGKYATDFLPAERRLDGVANLDTLIETGFYQGNFDKCPPGVPDGQGNVIVLNYNGGKNGESSGWTRQLFISAHFADVWRRNAQNSVWGDWGKINDGGNAATLNNTGYSNFVKYFQNGLLTAEIINDAGYREPYEGDFSNGPAVGLGLSNWWHIKYLKHSGSAGFGMQIASTVDLGIPQIYVRSSHGATWNQWTNIRDGGNAASVGGFYVQHDHAYGMHQIGIQPSDPGVGAPLSHGAICIVYE